MQAGAYDTVLILFYFSLSFCVSLSLFLFVTFTAQPLFSQRLPTYTRYQFTEDISAYQQSSQVIISHYHYVLRDYVRPRIKYVVLITKLK